jgi:hypothetical protein
MDPGAIAKEIDFIEVRNGVENLGNGRDPTPWVFLAKSAQCIENAGDIGICELRRACKRLKTKDCAFCCVAGEGNKHLAMGSEGPGGLRGKLI